MENENLFENRTDLSGIQQAVDRINQQFSKIIIGQRRMIDLMIAAMLANGHILIEGPPGIAKTLAAKLLAKLVSIGFSRIQFTPDLMPSDLLGTTIFNQKKSKFEFKRGPLFSNLILIDEVNRAPAKTQAALIEIMEERQATIDGTTYRMESPFLVVATQNPIEHEGTYKLPEAQIDRFLFKITVDYPVIEEEMLILSAFHERKHKNELQYIEPVLSGAEILELQSKVCETHVEQNLVRYIAEIVNLTRKHSAIYLGGSPRASLAILAGSKSLATMNGRDFITPEDIREVVFPALRHRILLTPEKEMEGAKPDDVIRQILEKIEVPR
jgi:MoxR-like ATPase